MNVADSQQMNETFTNKKIIKDQHKDQIRFTPIIYYKNQRERKKTDSLCAHLFLASFRQNRREDPKKVPLTIGLLFRITPMEWHSQLNSAGIQCKHKNKRDF